MPQQTGGVEHGVGAGPDARRDEAILPQEDRHVRLVERPRRPQAGRFAVERRAASARRGMQLPERVEHRGRRRSVLVLERDRAAPPAGQPGGERDGSVDPVHEPATGARAAVVGALLAEDGVAGSCGPDHGDGSGFGGCIGVRDEVGADALGARPERGRAGSLGGLGGGAGRANRD
jgi:hypothetical protein